MRQEGEGMANLMRLVFARTALEAGRLREDERGQGTTEYAILVGVLVVIAIVAIIAFRDKVSELWEAISTGINSL
jgi:Flp pilus assembly pilin Flp